jgi:hypothetical protein
VNVERILIALERRAVDVRNTAYAVSHNARRLVNGLGLRKPAAVIEIASQKSQNRLADREASARKYDEHPLTGLGEGVHLAAGVYLIEAGV